ncbi:UcrQ family protein [Neoconidiobolus thromboides FSU 785]|nr:UcrQ family protein [Neoconidiobolus thromboides FSU 785]
MAGGKYQGHWGYMGGPTQKGIVTYSLSPFQQRAYAGYFKKSFFGMVKRFGAQVPYIAPAFALGYSVYAWGNAKNAYYNSKAGAHEKADH